MMKSQLFYIYNYAIVKVRLFCWWCCVCCIVLLTLCCCFFICIFYEPAMTTKKLPLVGWLKVFEFNWTVVNQWLEFGQQQEDQHLLDSLTRKDPGLAAEFLRFACWARGVSSTTSMSLSLSSSSSLTTGTSGWNPGFFSVSPAPVWLLEGLEEVTLHCTLSMTRSLEEVTLYCTLSTTRSLEEITLHCTLLITRSLEEVTLHCTQSVTKSHTPLHTVQLMSKELKSSLSAIMVPINHNRITNIHVNYMTNT